MHQIATQLLWEPYLPLTTQCGLVQTTWKHTVLLSKRVGSLGLGRFYNVNSIPLIILLILSVSIKIQKRISTNTGTAVCASC